MDTPAIIETKSLTKIYKMGNTEIKALNSVSLEIKNGEFVAVMGPSGSGKSTLMNIIGCLDNMTSGKYFLNGEDVSGLAKENLASIRNRKIGFVFQSYNLLSRTSALDNVMLPLIYDKEKDWEDDEMKEHALKSLDSVGLGDRVDHLTQELSGGQRQRVAIARALINDPLLLLADEPTGNLDSKSGAEIMDILNLLHERGKTILMVTHENDIAKHAERVIHTRDGEIESDIQNGSVFQKKVKYETK